MSIQRTKLLVCRVKGCPWPESEEAHVCWARGEIHTECFGNISHQHWPKRSQGGKTIVACLCAGVHDRIDNFDWSNAVIDTEAITGTPPLYRVWNLRNETIIERPLRWWQNDVQAPKRDGPDTTLAVRRERPVLDVLPDVQGGPVLVNRYETWCEEIRRLGFMHRSLGWKIGDKIVEGEDAFGRDETWSAGILEELGVSFETLANMASVARAIPQSRRDERLSFSTYSALAPIFRRDHEEGLAWVERAIAEELSSREIRALLAPPRDVTEHKCCEHVAGLETAFESLRQSLTVMQPEYERAKIRLSKVREIAARSQPADDHICPDEILEAIDGEIRAFLRPPQSEHEGKCYTRLMLRCPAGHYLAHSRNAPRDYADAYCHVCKGWVPVDRIDQLQRIRDALQELDQTVSEA